MLDSTFALLVSAKREHIVESDISTSMESCIVSLFTSEVITLGERSATRELVDADVDVDVYVDGARGWCLVDV